MQPGQIIQQFRLISFLGDGGMGEVWLAENMQMGRKVAIKSLHTALSKNPELRARFKNEASTLAHLQHPNIVSMRDFIETDSGLFLVMEYVQGEGLDDYIHKRTGPIPEQMAVHLFSQILEGVAYAHGQGVVHRDIKPANFLITAEAQVKILDFGIARLLHGQAMRLTRTGSRMGTVLYMSPEQVKGEQTDVRSDIYSLGVTLFQMLTGACPYSPESSEYEVFNQIITHPLPRARDYYPAVSAKMQALIDRATAKNPDRRFQSCDEFLSALQDPDHAGERTGRSGRSPSKGTGNGDSAKGNGRRALWLALSGVLVLAVLSGCWYFFLGPGRGTNRLNFLSGPDNSPSEVAKSFLIAFELGDSTGYNKHADDDCKKSLTFYWANGNFPGRRVVIESEQVQEYAATVTYNHGGKTRSKQLKLWRERRNWKVECLKADLQE